MHTHKHTHTLIEAAIHFTWVSLQDSFRGKSSVSSENVCLDSSVLCTHWSNIPNIRAEKSGCSVLQYVAMCCSVVQCGAVCCGVSRIIFIGAEKSGCTVLQCLVACCSVLQCVAYYIFRGCGVNLQCVALCCSVLQCVAYLIYRGWGV